MEHFYEILWSTLAAIATGLSTWLVVVITSWLNSKIKDKKTAKIISDITTLIMTVVQKTFQTFVDALKKDGRFDAEAQQSAKHAAIAEIQRQLTVEQREYIMSIASNIEEWIGTQIESMIYKLKNK